MLAFETGSLENAKTVLKSVRLCSLAESLGGEETLISHPATMTYASIPPDERQRISITDGLVRISVGIEDVEDLSPAWTKPWRKSDLAAPAQDSLLLPQATIKTCSDALKY